MPLMSSTELTAEAAMTIAAGMRSMSRIDGEHPAEEQLIALFEESLPERREPGKPPRVDLGALTNDDAREAFLKSVILVALVDCMLSEEELDLLRHYTDEMGLPSETLERLLQEVAAAMLSRFSGVHVFRGQVEEIGRHMGLGDAAIERALAGGLGA